MRASSRVKISDIGSLEGFSGLRIFPTEISYGREGVGNALELPNSGFVDVALDGAHIRLH